MSPRDDATPSPTPPKPPRTPARRPALLAAFAAAGLVAAPAPARLLLQPAAEPTPARVDDPATDPAEALDAYLERLGLLELLAEHRAAMLRAATGERRLHVAERLSSLYVQLIARQTDEAGRRLWEDRAREMLKLVPEAQSLALRLDLARGVYAQAEDRAERWHLRLADADAKATAERVLRDLRPQFQSMGAEAHRRVEQLQRAEEAGRGDDEVTRQLGEARRLRSIAYYYAGWSGVYLALLTGVEAPAADALRDFGWLLGAAQGRPASVERVPKAFLKFDHIGRAVIGCAMASALRQQDVDATRWLDALDAEPAAPAALREQLLPRRIFVLARGQRWADLERFVRLARQKDPKDRAALTPLTAPAARLLAVMSFEAPRGRNDPLIASLAQIAMGDLVARNEVAQVLDLAQRYGTTALGDEGFIAHYVRGVQTYEQAMAAHRAAIGPEGDSDEPAGSPEVINAFRQAAAGLDGALAQTEAGAFPIERSRALVLAGRALFRAGDFEPASLRFAAAAENAPREQAEEALWLAVVALDRAVSAGRADLSAKLDALSALFLREHARSERAATLLVRRAGRGDLPDDEAVTLLMSVPADSPVYAAARRQAARLLYRLFRAAPDEGARAFAASRFVTVADELLRLDRQAAMQGSRQASDEAMPRVILLARQMLDALLSGPAPDPLRAETVLGLLDSAAAFNGVGLGEHEAELTFRRLQIALVRGDDAQAQTHLEALHRLGGRFAQAADRVLFQRAVRAWEQAVLFAATPVPTPAPAPGGPAAPATSTSVGPLARQVIEQGQRVLSQSSPAASDPATLTLLRTVAEAAAQLWRQEQDASARDLSLQLDARVLDAAPGTVDSLFRVGELAEAAGDRARALDAWRVLVNGLPVGAEGWFRARFHNARLLAEDDPAKADQALQQLVALFPDYGPTPWGPQLKALHDQIRARLLVVPAAPAVAPAPGAAPASPPSGRAVNAPAGENRGAP